MTSDDKVLSLLSNVVGPAPWYFKSFPKVETASRRYEWRRNEGQRTREFSVCLHPEGEDGCISLAIAMYTRVFAISPNLLGIWFEESRRIRIFVIDPDSLIDFSISEPLPASIQDYGGFHAGPVLADYWTSTDLEAGEHRIELPSAFLGMQNLLLLGEYARIREAACSAIFEIRPGSAPGSRRLCVYPQKWFNLDDYDLSYQWITRTTREPVDGRLVGDGIRIPPFILTEDGCRVDRWIGERGETR